MKQYDLICFDVDGTLIEHPTGKVIWELLNIRYGGSEQINQARYDSYMEGNITYDKWVELDVSDWIEKRATQEEIVEVVRGFRPHEGALETVEELKKRGYRLSVVSGTLDIVIDTIFPDHPFDDVFTNRIFFDGDGNLTGWKATPFDIFGKPIALRELARKYGTTLDRIAYIGDGDNDVPLLGVVGYFVAFNPRSAELERGADRVVKNQSMTKLLEIFE
ncbi:MAG: HAD-IB family phosphatase [Candidatus Latescibacteria bacterium]|nr:HAD-IB family phosphatase [Candidatus Latescibacterota bacterium]NIM21737.1 HAD-IB family phosphatase [Candidatus Latescibacterota bacterium]NIM65875.1 HAD-IB family phosphatase [Candidatus Latescibacterota bacterium]NIO02620.1 HAD-IB family phosphatase [Candidatus Latescibacterota bacterium]NIO29601.1 HAD-IB family phosphatase [Candidatus Latescibacterota bacterium]